MQNNSRIKQIDFSNIREGSPFFTDEIDQLIVSMQSMLTSLNNQKIELIESREKMQELAHTTLRSQEAERRYVSRELHDQAGQLLVSMRYTVKTLLSDLLEDEAQQTESSPKDEVLKKRLSTMLIQIDETLEMIRALSHKIRPALLDVGDINLAMQEYCDEFQQGKKINIIYEGSALPYIPEEIAISLFRFLQEGLTNVLKHADATDVIVRLFKEKEWIKMSVADNGRGAEAGSNQNGIGLAGMKERFLLLDGIVKAYPNKNGFVITAHVPISENRQP